MTGGRSYKLTGAWDHVEAACKKHGVGITLYNKVTPNPTTTAIDEAVSIARKDGAKAVIGIGGGSPIDAGKSAAVQYFLHIPIRRRKSFTRSSSRRIMQCL